ncbi:MAG TPA: deoxyribose-phosphate aldolase [Sphingobacteriaceae bacterium]|nr:deoxyribose-phosphate aldolase [Sphingobacteriaceae bacterium]
MQENDLARYIDHTLLTATATAADIIRLCREAVAYNFYAVCVHSRWLPLCRAQLAGTPVKLAAVIDFPHGAGLPSARTHAAAAAVAAGAGELDVVVPLPLVMEKDWRGITEDTRNLVEAAGPSVIIKVILEAGLLDEETLDATAQSVLAGGAHFLKTGTGTGPPATPEMVAHLYRLAHPQAQVKASGGIRTAEQARALVAAGATRLGTSSGVALMQPEPGRTD